ncbi:MAG: hypothetical protein AAFN70_10835, partial [Planctomycetota bacterium]
RQRQIALQQASQFEKQIEQQTSEQMLQIEKEMVKRKEELVEADRKVVALTTEAKQRQEVAVITANQRKTVAETELAAAKDQATAITARGEAAASVIQFENEAEAAGWNKAVEAYGGSGDAYARYVMLRKMAPSYRQMMVNTADSPLMEIFKEFTPEAEGTVAEALTQTSTQPDAKSLVSETNENAKSLNNNLGDVSNDAPEVDEETLTGDRKDDTEK